MKTSISLRARFTITLMLTIVILTVFLSFVIGKQSVKNISHEIGNSLAETSYQMADKLDSYMWSRVGEVEVLSKLNAIREPKDLNSARELLEQLRNSFPSYSYIGLTNTKGIIVASTGGILAGADVSFRPVYVEGLKGPFVGDVHDAVMLAKLLPNPSGEPLRFVDISTPIYGLDGRLTGILATHLSWEWAKSVQDSILKPLHSRKQVDILVISKADNTVILGPEDLLGKPLSLQSLTKAQAGENGWIQEQWPDGKTYLTGFALGQGYMNYKGLGWTVLVRQPADLAFTSVKELQFFILCVGVFAAILFAAAGWFMAGIVARPLQQISIAANKLKSGEKIELPQFKGIKEIEILSSSLRSLISTLTKTENALGQMEVLAQHDRLTGLPNRIALDFFIEQSVKLASTDHSTLTFLYLDLDNFKPVNDTYGHSIGDLLLQEVSLRLKKNIRGEELVARLGGDEFIVVLSTSAETPIDEARRVAARIIRDLREPFIIEGNSIKIGCSVGGAVWPYDGETPIDAMRRADEALYIAKRNGKNRIAFHGTEDHKIAMI